GERGACGCWYRPSARPGRPSSSGGGGSTVAQDTATTSKPPRNVGTVPLVAGTIDDGGYGRSHASSDRATRAARARAPRGGSEAGRPRRFPGAPRRSAAPTEGTRRGAVGPRDHRARGGGRSNARDT